MMDRLEDLYIPHIQFISFNCGFQLKTELGTSDAKMLLMQMSECFMFSVIFQNARVKLFSIRRRLVL